MNAKELEIDNRRVKQENDLNQTKLNFINPLYFKRIKNAIESAKEYAWLQEIRKQWKR